jgi:phosphoglycolate phosphatase
MKLVIFDLDQTLVDFIAVHNEATRQLFKKSFGVEAELTEIDFAGRSLTENLVALARLKGVSEEKVKKNIKQLLADYENIFRENIPQDASRHILPGVKRLLKALSKTDKLVVLYTGDSASIVDQVFRVTGFGKCFRFCVYGTEVQSRVDMVRLAVEKAERLARNRFTNKDIVIVGDSLRDIDCGKQFNALTIAVATGFHSEEELRAAKPDYLFKNLKDYKKVLVAIG